MGTQQNKAYKRKRNTMEVKQETPQIKQVVLYQDFWARMPYKLSNASGNWKKHSIHVIPTKKSGFSARR